MRVRTGVSVPPPMQPPLFDLDDLPAASLTPQERFEAFHEANPHVYRALRLLALRLRRSGRRHYGMKGLFEVLRFDRALRTDGDEFKLNNNYTAAYARKLMADEPELDGFFETRSSRADP